MAPPVVVELFVDDFDSDGGPVERDEHAVLAHGCVIPGVEAKGPGDSVFVAPFEEGAKLSILEHHVPKEDEGTDRMLTMKTSWASHFDTDSDSDSGLLAKGKSQFSAPAG